MVFRVIRKQALVYASSPKQMGSTRPGPLRRPANLTFPDRSIVVEAWPESRPRYARRFAVKSLDTDLTAPAYHSTIRESQMTDTAA
jgi:hypothetical protein